MGLGDFYREETPKLIPDMTNIKQISAGGDKTLLLTYDGYVYICGFHHLPYINKPLILSEIYNIISVAAGVGHSLLLTNEGNVYSFGYNVFGQLGLGDTKTRLTPILIPNLTHINQISSGGSGFSLALITNGLLYSFGNNEYGQLGLGDYINKKIPTLIHNIINIVQISAGFKFSMVLTYYGQVYACGYNNQQNILTLISNVNNVVQIAAGRHHSLILAADGKIYLYKYTLVLISTAGIRIAAGDDYSLIFKNDNRLYKYSDKQSNTSNNFVCRVA